MAWGALTLAGGVWLEAYSGTTPWSPEQWPAWPGAFARLFAPPGRPPSRPHLVPPAAGAALSSDAALTRDARGLPLHVPGALPLRRAAPPLPVPLSPG